MREEKKSIGSRYYWWKIIKWRNPIHSPFIVCILVHTKIKKKKKTKFRSGTGCQGSRAGGWLSICQRPARLGYGSFDATPPRGGMWTSAGSRFGAEFKFQIATIGAESLQWLIIVDNYYYSVYNKFWNIKESMILLYYNSSA